MPTKTQQGVHAPLDVSAIVAFFGGAAELALAFEKHGINDLSTYAVRQWMRRKHIPFSRRADLEVLAGRQRKDFSLEKFRKSGAAPASKKARG